MAVEKRIAEIHWPREKSRDRDLTYNPKNRAELLAFAPEFPWEARLAAFGAPTDDEFIVAQLDAVQSLAKLYRRTSVDVWRAYLTFHYLNANADVLPKALRRSGVGVQRQDADGHAGAACALEARGVDDERHAVQRAHG